MSPARSQSSGDSNTDINFPFRAPIEYDWEQTPVWESPVHHSEGGAVVHRFPIERNKVLGALRQRRLPRLKRRG